MGLELGQVVYSKLGRDKGGVFLVVGLEGEYAYLADGDTRPLARAKKKKYKHIQPTNTRWPELAVKVSQGTYIQDAELRKYLGSFLENRDGKGGSGCLRTT